MSEHIEFLRKLLSDDRLHTIQSALNVYGTDWTSKYKPAPLAVAFPKTTEEISQILAYCSQNNVKVVPSGGRTGLAAGAVAKDGELVVSLEKMNKIISKDSVGMTIEAEAGVTTQALQDAAKSMGLFFALDLAAKGSSQIGGNLATNAGGLKLIKYGGAREQVLGLEAVMANGTILDLNTALRKNNVGYDLKQLLISSEGTLGIITKVTVKLFQQPKPLQLLCMAVDEVGSVAKILELANKMQLPITAFEMFDRGCAQIVTSNHTDVRYPFKAVAATTCLLEYEELSDATPSLIEEFFTTALENNYCQDGVISSSHSEFSELWALRELISESVTTFAHLKKNDVSVAVKDLVEFIRSLKEITATEGESFKVVLFGHVGDGNVHLNYLGRDSLTEEDFAHHVEAIEKKVFSLIKKFKGSISAEHGIGLLKKNDLSISVSNSALSLMKQIKLVFDPKNILNPGKIFDL